MAPARKQQQPVDDILAQARACTLCSDLPRGPRPVFRIDPRAKLLIVGQAPGTKVHETGVPWNDASGERLRDWLQMDRDRFYDGRTIAILPTGLCYPGADAKGGDLPPRKACAPLWHPRLRPLMPNIRLTLLVGSYAQAYYLGRRRAPSMTETVANFRAYLPEFMPLPHPSWRNTAWIRRHPWFEAELLPVLRRLVRNI